jgi:hypothetical protein
MEMARRQSVLRYVAYALVLTALVLAGGFLNRVRGGWVQQPAVIEALRNETLGRDLFYRLVLAVPTGMRMCVIVS